MNNSICGIDCTKCELKDTCSGCVETNGHPFGGNCIIAKCSQDKGQDSCNSCINKPCKLKENLIAEFNALGIKNMAKVTSLNALLGAFVNVEYKLPNGQVVKLLDNNKIYLGSQICMDNSNRCYGLAADEDYILVCEYGVNGADAEIIIYKKRDK